MARNKHTEVMRADMEILIPIIALDMDSIGKANAVVDEIREVCRKHKSAISFTTRLDRRPEADMPK